MSSMYLKKIKAGIKLIQGGIRKVDCRDSSRLMEKAKGVLEVIEAEHMCLAMRGMRRRDSQLVTPAMRGTLRRAEIRSEPLALIGRSIELR